MMMLGGGGFTSLEHRDTVTLGHLDIHDAQRRHRHLSLEGVLSITGPPDVVSDRLKDVAE